MLSRRLSQGHDFALCLDRLQPELLRRQLKAAQLHRPRQQGRKGTDELLYLGLLGKLLFQVLYV
jgi:hypothetical protein